MTYEVEIQIEELGLILTVCTDSTDLGYVDAHAEGRRFPGRSQRSQIAGGGRPGECRRL